MPPLARLRHWVEPEALLAYEQPDTVYQALREVVVRLQSAPAILTADPRPAPPIETAGFTLHMAADRRRCIMVKIDPPIETNKIFHEGEVF